MAKSVIKVFAVCSAIVSLVACSSGGGGGSTGGGASANTLTPAVTGPVSGAGLLSLGVKPMSAGISIKGGSWPTGGEASGAQFFSAVTGFYIAGAAADLFSCYAKALNNNATTVSGFDDGSDHYALGFDDVSRYKFKVTKGTDGSVSSLTATICDGTTPTLTLSYDGATNTTKVLFASSLEAVITGTYSGGTWLNKTVNFAVGSSNIKMTQASSTIDILGISGLGIVTGQADFYGKTTISGTSYSTYKMGEGSMTDGTATASWGDDGLTATSSTHKAAVEAHDLNYTPSSSTGLTHWNCTDGWSAPVSLVNASNAFKMEAMACETSFAAQ